MQVGSRHDISEAHSKFPFQTSFVPFFAEYFPICLCIDCKDVLSLLALFTFISLIHYCCILAVQIYPSLSYKLRPTTSKYERFESFCFRFCSSYFCSPQASPPFVPRTPGQWLCSRICDCPSQCTARTRRHSINHADRRHRQ